MIIIMMMISMMKRPAAASRLLLVAVSLVLATTTAFAPGFVCVTLDWWPETKCNYNLCPWHDSSIWAINLTEIEPYSKLLGPFLLRIGGSLQDQVDFVTHDCTDEFPVDSDSRQGFGSGCITPSRLNEIADFCRRVNCQLVWGLNGMAGRAVNGTGDWNSTNSQVILRYLYNNKAPLYAVTLGNEIWGRFVNLTVQQAVDSFGELDRIITDIWGASDQSRPLIAGFDSYATDDVYFQSLIRTLKTQNTTLDVLTYHDYPLGSSNDKDVLKHALNPNLHDDVQRRAAEARKVASYYAPHSPQVWMSECGGSYNSGSQKATGTYASGFWYLDGMAVTQAQGHTHYCRQTLAGGFYGLLTNASPRKPHADYWNAVLYQKLMGPPVGPILQNQLLSDTTCHEGRQHPNRVHWYVHCAKRNHEASLVVMGINYHDTSTCSVFVNANDTSTVIEYRLTPDGNTVTAINSLLNGELLRVDDGRFPSLTGKVVESNQLSLEPLTYGFFELVGVPSIGCFDNSKVEGVIAS